MTLPDNWEDGQTIHGSDIDAIADAVNEDTTGVAELQTEVGAESAEIAVLQSASLASPADQFCTIDRLSVGNWTIDPPSGAVSLTFGRPGADLSVSNIAVAVGAAAASDCTVCQLGIYSVDEAGDLALLAATANDPTLCSSANSSPSAALGSEVTLRAGTTYAFAFLMAAATMPQIHGSYTTDSQLAPILNASLPNQESLPASIPAASLQTNYFSTYVRAF